MSPQASFAVLLVVAGVLNSADQPQELYCRVRPETGAVCWENKAIPMALWEPAAPKLQAAVFAEDSAPPADQFSRMGKAWFQFKDGRAMPLLPAAFMVKPLGALPSPVPQGVMACEFFKRVRGVGEYEGKPLIVQETVLKCGGAYYLLNGVLFQGSKTERP